MPPEAGISNARQATGVPLIGGAVGLLALAFLLPNHAPPWMSFLQECLAVAALIVLALPTLLRERESIGWRWTELLVLGLLAVAATQYLLGLIPFLQTAWMGGLYLFGLLVSMLVGAALERQSPTQVLWILLAATWLAGIISVGLQFYQGLALQPGEGTLWVYRATGARPAANLGQPNSLATLIMFAVLSTYWFWRRRILGPWWALLTAAFLLLGLAQTQSRTGLLNALLVGSCLLLWHRRRTGPPITLQVLGLLVLLFAAFASYSVINVQMGVHAGASLAADRASAGVRPQAWRLFVDAILDRPIGGYGWGQSFVAQMSEALNHPGLNRVFLSAHNLLLDLALWVGLPVALAFTVALVLWLGLCLRRMNGEVTLLLLLFVAVLLVHSMFEYPLTYAYFLLPAGLAAGALNQRVGMRVVWRAPAGFAVGLLVAGTLAFGVTVRDYLRVEQSYRDLLLEKARIISDVQGLPPDVLVLTSLRDLVAFSRVVPRAGMPDAQLAWMADVVRTHPGATGFATVATALALNGSAVEAQRWVDMLCSIFSKGQCAALAVDWATKAEEHHELRTVRWP